MIEMTLTDEQKALVTENHQLIFGYLTKKGLNIDEYYDLAAIGLCKAAMNYRKNSGKFSTLAYRCIHNEIYNEYRQKNQTRAIPEDMISSYNMLISNCNGDDIEVLDTLKSDFDIEKYVLDNVLLEKLYEKLSDKYKMTLILALKGYNNCEIGDILGYSDSTIWNIKKKIALIYGEI